MSEKYDCKACGKPKAALDSAHSIFDCLDYLKAKLSRQSNHFKKEKAELKKIRNAWLKRLCKRDKEIARLTKERDAKEKVVKAARRYVETDRIKHWQEAKAAIIRHDAEIAEVVTTVGTKKSTKVPTINPDG